MKACSVVHSIFKEVCGVFISLSQTLSLSLFLSDCPRRDYQSIARLDTYDEEHLDEEQYEAMGPEARVAAEKAMRKRDRQVSGGRGGS